MQRVAIVGAGIAGASIAKRFSDAGYQVCVFEKSRGSGGRLASARLSSLSGDLGSDYIEAQSDEFKTFLRELETQRVAQRWDQAQHRFDDQTACDRELWVGVGRNSAITRHLLQGSQLVTEERIGVIWPDREGVLLRDEQGESLGHFDAVICAAPAPQAVPLLEAKTRFAQTAQRAVTQAAWVKLVELDRLPAKLADKTLIEGGHPAIARLVVESSKPGREGVVIKIQMTPEWTEENLNLSSDTISAEISHLFELWCGETVHEIQSRTHRWLYCGSVQPQPELECLWDEDLKLGACGDWVAMPGIEGSWLSAQRLADRILSRVNTAA